MFALIEHLAGIFLESIHIIITMQDTFQELVKIFAFRTAILDFTNPSYIGVENDRA